MLGDAELIILQVGAIALGVERTRKMAQLVVVVVVGHCRLKEDTKGSVEDPGAVLDSALEAEAEAVVELEVADRAGNRVIGSVEGQGVTNTILRAEWSAIVAVRLASQVQLCDLCCGGGTDVDRRKGSPQWWC